MWGVLNFGAKLASRYLLPRHWIRYVLLASVVVLAILNGLLVDAKLYWTAGLTGVLAVVGLIVFGIQFIRASREKAERQRLQAETAARRAAAAQARAEKIQKVRTSVTEAAKGLGGSAAHLTKSSAANFADLTKNSAAGLANVTSSAAHLTKSSAANFADLTKRGVAGSRDRLGAWRNKPSTE
jgi:hypothetical protein